jgi:hypothetical protein
MVVRSLKGMQPVKGGGKDFQTIKLVRLILTHVNTFVMQLQYVFLRVFWGKKSVESRMQLAAIQLAVSRIDPAEPGG